MHSYLIIISWLLVSSMAHDIQVGYFKIHQSEDQVYIDITLEKNDILHVFGEDIQFTEEALFAYLNKNFSVSINMAEHQIEFNTLDIKEKHIHVTAIFPYTVEAVNSLKVNNTCLLDVDDQSNVIEIRLNNQERDFLMNNDRTTINVEF